MTAPVHLRIVESAQHAERADSDVPLVELADGHIPETLDQIGAALARAPDIFVWAGRLVRLHRRAAPSKSAALRRPEGSVVLVPIDGAHLIELIGRYTTLTKFDGRSGCHKAADCPRRIADAYLSRGHWPEHKTLTGIVESATISPDERLLDKTGFDPQSGIFVACEPAHLPGWERIPVRPDADDAKAAVDLLLEAIDSWPFVDDGDRSAALAALISTLTRRSLPAAPLVAISATAAGTGKSMLADWMTLIGTGRRPAVMSLGHDEAEDEKRLAGALLAGDPVINLDNVSRSLSSDLLCQTCTQPAVRVRPLGGSALVSAPTNSQLMATGNGLTITGDLKRRTLLIRLDAGVERPELREFDNDPLADAIEMRGRFVRAALVIPLAYLAAGAPTVDLPPLGSFGEWDRLIRRPLRWLGLPDPLAPAETLREFDPELESSRLLLCAWHAVFGSRPVPATEVVSAALATAPMSGEHLNPELREALQLICHEKITARRLSGWLRSNRDRIVEGHRAVQCGIDGHSKVARWAVKADACG